MSDAFVVMPGGIGTVLEAMMIWQLLQVGRLQDTRSFWLEKCTPTLPGVDTTCSGQN
jgi:predicted Rossmann-fold nucleotide-binding protein